MSQEFTAQHQRMLALSALVLEPLRSVISVELSDESDRRFRRFFDAVDPPNLKPQSLRTWEAIHDVRDGLTAATYHQRNVLRLEQEIAEICRDAYARASESPIDNPTTIGVGAQNVTYEYHAFLFAIRRTLEYLGRGVAAYFDRSPKSFRRTSRALQGATPSDRAEAVAHKVTDAVQDLEDILGRGDARAPRDRIAHTRPEEPGIFNIIFSPSGNVGVSLVGGAENFKVTLSLDRAEPQLAPVLAERCSRVERLTFELLTELPEFRAAAISALKGT